MAEIPTWLPVVAVALQDGEGRWLMQRRPAGKHHGGLWEFPGGKVETDEIPLVALVREVREELGIVIDPGDLHPFAFADNGVSQTGQPIVILLYRSIKWTGEPQALEGGAVGWFSDHQITALAKPPLDAVLAEQLIGRFRQ